jgi:hypothetical protein
MLVTIGLPGVRERPETMNHGLPHPTVKALQIKATRDWPVEMQGVVQAIRAFLVPCPRPFLVPPPLAPL